MEKGLQVTVYFGGGGGTGPGAWSSGEWAVGCGFFEESEELVELWRNEVEEAAAGPFIYTFSMGRRLIEYHNKAVPCASAGLATNAAMSYSRLDSLPLNDGLAHRWTWTCLCGKGNAVQQASSADAASW